MRVLDMKNCTRHTSRRKLDIIRALLYLLYISEGRLYDECPAQCPEVYSPVCGTDFNIYLNECYLRRANCG